MESSRAAARRERELDATDPFRLHWRKLSEKVNGTPSGWHQLSATEQQYWAVNLVSGEVANGGFHQYFFNSSGASYQAALLGLEGMRATESLSLLEQAKRLLFGFQDVPLDTSLRRRTLESVDRPLLHRQLDVLDRQFWKDPDKLGVLIEDFAVRHALVQVSRPDLPA